MINKMIHSSLEKRDNQGEELKSFSDAQSKQQNV